MGRAVASEPAWIADFTTYWAEFGDFAVLLPKPGARAEGILVRDWTQKDAARLAYFERGFGYGINQAEVETANGQMFSVELNRSSDASGGRLQGGALLPWQFDDWRQRFAAEFEATFVDFMSHMGLKRPSTVAARYPQMLVRGAARVRAREVAPTQRRHHAIPTDVSVSELRDPYARFFSVEEIDVSYRRFDGTMSAKVTRAGFVSGDAVTVLPYDAKRDRVLVVEQFRTGPYLRGDPQPWQLEAVAGRIDAGETPKAAALRESQEEAGLSLTEDSLLMVASYYPSPGIMSEYLYSYVALVDLPDGSAGVFGLDGEAEDIRGHLLDFDTFMALVASGEIGNAPTLISAHWLAARRAQLRTDAASR